MSFTESFYKACKSAGIVPRYLGMSECTLGKFEVHHAAVFHEGIYFADFEDSSFVVLGYQEIMPTVGNAPDETIDMYVFDGEKVECFRHYGSFVEGVDRVSRNGNSYELFDPALESLVKRLHRAKITTQ